jgi:endo-1,4-beta-xylanase
MSIFSRRAVLGSAAGLGAGIALPAWAQDSTSPSLDALANAKNMRFGSCVAWSPPGADAGSYANPAYAALLERDCGILVPENEMKWQALRPDAKTFNVDRFAGIVGYAEAHGMAVRGHTLLWHKTQYFPRWLNSHDFGATPAREAERILGTHIRTVCKLYAGRVVSFDVVNETVDEKTGAQRDSSLARAFGGADAMVDFAFRTAREHAPGVQLVYNDYMSWEPGNENHRYGVLKLLEGLKKRGVPIDALGVQSHIAPSGDAVAAQVARQSKPWRQFLDTATQMGLGLVVTELDVNDKQLPKDAATRDGIVADYARAYLDILFAYPQLRHVLAWGMCDKYSWLNGFTPRGDGTLQRATPYDASFRAKPLRQVLADAFAAAAPRAA